MSPLRARRSRAHTLLEMTLAMSIMVGVLLIVSEFIGSAQHAQIYINARNKAMQYAGKLITDLRGAGLASRRLYQDDAEGRSYLAALDSTKFPVLAGARLPVVDSKGRLDPDAPGVRRTGNALLLACEDRPREFSTPGGGRYRVDIVRFVAVYPTRRAGKVVDAAPDRIDLVRFSSRPYADKGSLEQIPVAADRVEVVKTLTAQGVGRAWVAGAPIDSAFFDLKADGSIAATAVASPVIDCPPEAPVRTMLNAVKASVAPNSPALRVPTFAELDTSAPGFPSGFEVKVVGPSGGREVFVRLVVLVGVAGGPDAQATSTRLFSVRDL